MTNNRDLEIFSKFRDELGQLDQLKERLPDISRGANELFEETSRHEDRIRDASRRWPRLVSSLVTSVNLELGHLMTSMEYMVIPWFSSGRSLVASQRKNVRRIFRGNPECRAYPLRIPSRRPRLATEKHTDFARGFPSAKRFISSIVNVTAWNFHRRALAGLLRIVSASGEQQRGCFPVLFGALRGTLLLEVLHKYVSILEEHCWIYTVWCNKGLRVTDD